MIKTGIIIGRFQVPYLHKGHKYLINTALKECEKVVFLLGVNKEDGKNLEKYPYKIGERLANIRKEYDFSPKIDYFPLYDYNNDLLWSKQVDSICSRFTNPILYHSRDSFKKSYITRKYPLREVLEIKGYSGTKIRKESMSKLYYDGNQLERKYDIEDDKISFFNRIIIAVFILLLFTLIINT